MGSRRIAKTRSLSSYLSSVNQTSTTAFTKTNAANDIATNAITSDALAQDLQIFDKTVQSGNYVEGYSGWKIAGTGDAEFGNVVVRGDINASSGTIGYWNISNPAVTRVIGSTTLLGTFVESSNPGPNDLAVTSGSYVGLFKSYTPDAVPVTGKERTSDVATLTIPDHQFEVGDSVYITLEDDTTFNNADAVVTVTVITPTTISYANPGTNVSSSDTSGYAQLYNPDVAGLYLRDYSKTEFDYGFFSNKGVKYVSAEKVNLVHNPSFEFATIDWDILLGFESLYATSVGWVSTSITTATVSTSDIAGLAGSTSNLMLGGNSVYAKTALWTSTAPGDTEYLVGTVDYAVAQEYGIFANDKSLTFNFDVFFQHTREPVGGHITYAETGIQTTNVIAKSITSNVAKLVTDRAHGYAVGESVVVTGVDTIVTVTTKARTLTTVTLGFASTTHKIVTGDSITVAISDANYDGTYTVASATATAITYSKTSATTQTTTAASGTITHNLYNGTYTITDVGSWIYPITSISVTNKVATATTATLTVPSGHGIIAGDFIDVRIRDGRFDGVREVTSVTTTTIVFASAGVVVASTAVTGGSLGKDPLSVTALPYFSYAKTHANYTSTDISAYTSSPQGVCGLATQMAINTSSAHGLSVGDIVYIDGYSLSDYFFGNGTYPLGYSSVDGVSSPAIFEGHSFVVEAVPSSTWFTFVPVTDPTDLLNGAGEITSQQSYWEITSVGNYSGTTYTVTIGSAGTASGSHPFQVGDEILLSITNRDYPPEWATYQTITAVGPSTIQFQSTSVDIDGENYKGLVSFRYANIYKYVSPQYDLSKINFQFGNDTGAIAPIYDLLSTVGLSNWASASVRYETGDYYLGIAVGCVTDYVNEHLPLTSPFGYTPVEVSSKAIYDAYVTLNPTGLASGENIYIQFPIALYAGDISGTITETKLVQPGTKSIGIHLDNVQLSNSPEFFFGNSGIDFYRWYGQVPFENVADANRASIKGTKTWIDIDLDTQTSILRADAIFLDENAYSNQIFTPSYIGQYSLSTANAYDSLFGYIPADGNIFLANSAFNGAEIAYAEETSAQNSYLRGSMATYAGVGYAGVELVAREKVVSTNNASDPTSTMPTLAGITAWVDTTRGATTNGVVRIYADSIELYKSSEMLGLEPSVGVNPPLSLNYAFGAYSDVLTSLPSYYNVGPGGQSPDFAEHAAHINVMTNYTTTLGTDLTYGYRSSGSGASTVLTSNSCYLIFRTGPSGLAQITIGIRADNTNVAASACASYGVFPYTRVNGSNHPYIGVAAVFTPLDEYCIQIQGTDVITSSITNLFSGLPNTTYVVALATRTTSASYQSTFYTRTITVVPVP